MGTPWELADDAASRAGVRVRSLATLEDVDALLDVMVATWGQRDLLSREIVRALQIGGNRPLGAFAGDRLVGYVLGFLGGGDDGLHVHSHMLAVLPESMSSGVGFALKLAQRASALDAGVTVARWTFDPMQRRNAHFNLVKLGAVADRFHRELYGEMTDTLNRGERSDRLEARWDLVREPGPRPVPTDATIVDVPADATTLDVPADRALIRDALADRIEKCLAEGLVATGFLERGAYVFSREA
jgi:predicted GNAT superfamily acetyltransferase